MNIDKKAEAYYPITPYQYVLNNPVVHMDHNGQWTVTNHYNLTYYALSEAGIGRQQADLIAHYSSVYADRPNGFILWLNNTVHPLDYVRRYREGIDYSDTQYSQRTVYRGTGYNYNIWHSMSSNWEREHGVISNDGAMKRGLQFGWSKIFESAESGQLNQISKNSAGIKSFGQGIHALQDAYAHKGVTIDDHSAHNDRFGSPEDMAMARSITETAIGVHNLLTENWASIDSNGLKLTNLEGMSSEQINKLMNQIIKYLERDEKDNE